MANELTPEDLRVGQHVRISNQGGAWLATVVAKSKKMIIVVGDDGVQRTVQYNSKPSMAQRSGHVGWYDPAVGNRPEGRVNVVIEEGEGRSFFDLVML